MNAHAAAPGDPFAAGTFGGTATPEPADLDTDTLVFAAARDPEPCQCGMPGCPDSGEIPEPTGRHAILSAAAGVTTRMAAERVRNGQYEDIPKFCREGAVRVHRPAVDGRARIQLDTEHGVLDLQAMFDRNEALHWDPELDRDLDVLEAEHAGWLAAVHAGGWRALPVQSAKEKAA